MGRTFDKIIGWNAYRIKKLRICVVLFIALIAFNIFIGNNTISTSSPSIQKQEKKDKNVEEEEEEFQTESEP